MERGLFVTYGPESYPRHRFNSCWIANRRLKLRHNAGYVKRRAGLREGHYGSSPQRTPNI